VLEAEQRGPFSNSGFTGVVIECPDEVTSSPLETKEKGAHAARNTERLTKLEKETVRGGKYGNHDREDQEAETKKEESKS